MRHHLGDSRIRYYIGDVREYQSVLGASRGATHVFHAAALKQVPSAEFFPLQAVQTNVLGSANVVRAAEENRVRSLVCLSTDKAVYPINAMGMTKALMEKVAQAHGLENPDASTTVSCVRYGNVMYSRGSVIPLFVNQLKRGKRITVTDPNMTRFMMSLEHSVDLVAYAFRHAAQGDLFIRKAPACTMGDLAIAISELFGVEPRIEVIGTRHGEKLFESLATREELARAEDHGDYFRIGADKRDLNYRQFFSEGDRRQGRVADYDSHSTERLDVKQVKQLLQSLPEIRAELQGRSTMNADVDGAWAIQSPSLSK
jgi:UDP-glucose 4-epimerase